ncbi:MAG: HEAT repeat domain-containing protein [Candidatus Ratteibacteria bacterium]
MKNAFKLSIFVFFIIFSSSPWLFIKGQLSLSYCDVSEINKTEKDVEEEIGKLIKKFSIKEITEKEKYDIKREIEKFELKALPFILQVLKEANDEERQYYYLSMITEIIGRKKRAFEISRTNLTPEEIERNKIDITEFPLSQEDKENIDKAFLIVSDFGLHHNPKIRVAAMDALGCFGTQKAVFLLERALNDEDATVRYVACIRLSLLGHCHYNRFKVMTGKEPKTPEEYAEFLSDTKWGLWIQAEQELKKFGKQAIPVLLEVASSDKEPGRQRAIKLLGEMKAEEAVPVLGEKFKREPNDTSSLYALAHIGTPEAIDILVQYGLKHEDANVKMNTAKALLPEHRNTAIPFLKELAKHKERKVRLEAGRILVEKKEKAGISVLIELLGNPIHAGNARIMLEEVTKQNFGRLPPVVSKKMVDDYVNKWNNWWEENKDTFKFPDN